MSWITKSQCISSSQGGATGVRVSVPGLPHVTNTVLVTQTRYTTTITTTTTMTCVRTATIPMDKHHSLFSPGISGLCSQAWVHWIWITHCLMIGSSQGIDLINVNLISRKGIKTTIVHKVRCNFCHFWKCIWTGFLLSFRLELFELIEKIGLETKDKYLGCDQLAKVTEWLSGVCAGFCLWSWRF